MFYTYDQVEKLTLSQTKQALSLLTKTYNLNKPITECMELVWDDLDQICDTLLYLEDHLAQLNNPIYSLKNAGLLDEEEEKDEEISDADIELALKLLDSADQEA